MQGINDTTKKPLHSMYAGTSAYNAADTQIQKNLRTVRVSFIGRVDSCASSGHEGARTVTATPLVAQVDANGNALPSPSYPPMPHYRVAAGVAALILDPVPGDIGVFVNQQRDSSGIQPGTKEPAPPASFRSNGAGDAVMTGTILTQAPKVWIEIAQDQTVTIHAPAGVKIETDAQVEIRAPSVTISGNLTVAGTLTAGGINMNRHRHGNIEPGSGTSGGPQ